MKPQLSLETTQPFSVKLKWNKDIRGKELDEMFGEIKLHKSLIHLHRKIEQQYKDLPWPPSVKRATVMTEAPGGRGDVAAAGRAIKIIQDNFPSLEFDWVVVSEYVAAKPFLNCTDPSKVNISNNGKKSELLIVGPASCGWNRNYIECKIGAKIKGPRFCFLEAGTEESNPTDLDLACMYAGRQASTNKTNKTYLRIHKRIFSTSCQSEDGICMGLLPGSGIFFDQSRLDAELSREYCCPEPLKNIVDDSLRHDILRSLDCQSHETLPNFDLHSFNSGYAHRPTSWGKFIDFVSIQEREKHVTIVLNQHGEFDRPSTSEFCKMIFTPERLESLKNLGYGKIMVKGEESEAFTLQESTESSQRNLTVIIRPSFKPEDMKQLQLASERLIATGMNTPAESWAAKCKLYIYEDVDNGGVTYKFLEQQIKIAQKINPKLGRLLEISGTRNKPLTPKEMAEATEILHDPELSTATLNFCNHITSNFRFQDALMASLKRVMWHHYIPKLNNVEASAMDADFKEGVLKYLGNFNNEKEVIEIRNLPILAQRIQIVINNYLQNQ